MKTKLTIGLLLLLYVATGCKKQFLDAKPNDNLVIPSGLGDMQQLLDNMGIINGGKNIYGADPSLAIASCDEYYMPFVYYNVMTDYNKAVYSWAKYIPWPAADKNWKAPYRVVFYANSVLEGIKNVQPSLSEQASYNSIKGSALFYRSFHFFNLAQIFTQPYDASKASAVLGIPLRLTPDISEVSVRATLQQTYDRIVNDLIEATTLLPNQQALQTRPSKPAAFALLARVYLSMGDYSKSLIYCDSALKINNTLLDYNTISPTVSVPFAVLNQEVLYQSSVSLGNGPLAAPSSASSGLRVDTTLISHYTANDLRLKLFFKTIPDGKFIFKGFYSGGSIPFSGIANDEVYLMQAECFARANDVANAMKSLNILLKKRYSSATFTDVTASDPADALNRILEERRKELAFRSLRWMDLRRLNKEGRNISVTRNVNGTIYTLPPNDVKYTWPIPDDVIGLTGMQQNPR
jgi:tetratricopeptide (TPR) repeat protein